LENLHKKKEEKRWVKMKKRWSTYFYMVMGCYGYYFKDSFDVSYSWLDFFAYFSYCVELKGCVWVLTEQEEVGEFENNWVGKGGEL
jgi:hypothetical protein